jgi:hypothetical protein
MGQQQLLLLVLSTVIVGLATVAGIQAFDENQRQATLDALTQRSIEIATDIKAAHETPSAMGGIDLKNLSSGSGESTVAGAIGVSSATGISADGAGGNATCDIDLSLGDNGGVVCGTSDDPTGSGSAQSVQATIDLDASGDVISTSVNSVSN